MRFYGIISLLLMPGLGFAAVLALMIALAASIPALALSPLFPPNA